MRADGFSAMNKLLIFTATALLTIVFVCCVLAGVVATDELGRLPFYHTLPIAALLVNCSWLFSLICKRGQIHIFTRTFARLASVGATVFRFPSRIGGAQVHSSSASASSRARYAGYNRPSRQRIERVGKIHSVAWGFPGKSKLVDPMNRKEQASDQARP